MVCFKLYFVICIFLTADSQEFGWGRCPTVSPMENFNPTSFLGVWYEIGRYHNDYESKGTCQYLNIFLNGSIYNIIHRQLDKQSQQGVSQTGEATLTSPPSGRVNVKFNGGQDYFILKTDYWTYASVYGCNDYFLYHYKFGYMYSRKVFQIFNEYGNAKAAFNASGLSTDNMKVIDQMSCLFFV